MTATLRLTAAERELIERTRLAQSEQDTSQAEQRLTLLRRAREGIKGARDAILKTVSAQLDLAAPIVGVVKVTSDPPEYHLLLDEGGSQPTRLRLGGVEHLDTQALFGRAFLLTLGLKPCKVKPAEWDRIVTSLASCADVEKPDEATTDAGRGARWVAQALAGAGEPVDLRARDKADRDDQALVISKGMQPFRDEKGLHVFLTAVQRRIRLDSHGGENPSTAEIARCLTAAGCERQTTKFPHPDKDTITTRSTWLVRE